MVPHPLHSIKNSRMLSEFREIDSYMTDSDDSSYENMEGAQPTLAQTEFDNSVLRMGRALIAAARANPLEGTDEIPKVTLRLTRLEPSSTSENDPRIAQTVKLLLEMGVDVQLGERKEAELPVHVGSKPTGSSPSTSLSLIPTININLDLSVLIALISDLSHAPLPTSIEEANGRFIPPQSYGAWKVKKNGFPAKSKKASSLAPPYLDRPDDESDSIPNAPHAFTKHSRALANQLLQEMGKGLLQEIHEKILMLPPHATVKFWTTPEARDRCLRIIAKIGGPGEKRRAHALFWTVSTLHASDQVLSSESEAEDSYWLNSRYSPKFVALFPIHIFPPTFTPQFLGATSPAKLPVFFAALRQTCTEILAQETIPHPRALPDELVSHPEHGEIQRAIVTKANPRLTAHTVQSLLWGAELGWTTLTANKTSIRAIMREMKNLKVSRKFEGPADDETSDADSSIAGIWIVDPRSLAEGMSNLYCRQDEAD
ncbi:hypothetical protein H0H93_003239 [Arthromyces matolae]|nr:hypothetical protein H0H93_003239 [Arthromyces matolae]